MANAAAAMFYFVYRALAHIRRREVAEHRQFMMRAFAVGGSVVTMRLLDGAFFELNMLPERTLFSLTLWIGLGLNLGLAEWWIRTQVNRHTSP